MPLKVISLLHVRRADDWGVLSRKRPESGTLLRFRTAARPVQSNSKRLWPLERVAYRHRMRSFCKLSRGTNPVLLRLLFTVTCAKKQGVLAKLSPDSAADPLPSRAEGTGVDCVPVILARSICCSVGARGAGRRSLRGRERREKKMISSLFRQDPRVYVFGTLVFTAGRSG
jgi:hypothetical protein